MDLYADNILDHYRHPRGKEALPSPTIVHKELNPSCGDELTVELIIKNGKIEQIGWSGEGCAISQAGMSMLSEELTGTSLEEIEEMKPQHMYDLLGVPVGLRRVKCALLALHTVRNASLKTRDKPEEDWSKFLMYLSQ